MRWLVCLVLLGGCAPRGTELTVSAAASLSNAMRELAANYQGAHPGTIITMNFGSSGMLAQQIEQGAPADVFLSAAPKPMDTLAGKGLIRKDTRRDLLRNEVVLIGSIDSFAALAGPKVKLIALGDPNSVPAGDYGKQVLTALGLWDAVQSKLVLAKDVRQVLSYVETGNADAGIVLRDRCARIAQGAGGGDGASGIAHSRGLSGGGVDGEPSRSRRAIVCGVPVGGRSARGVRAARIHSMSPLWISVKTSIAATALTFVLGIAAAWAMSRYRGRWRGVLDGIFILPLVLPPTVAGFFLLLLFGRHSPIGLRIAFSWWATVVAATVVAFPLMYRTALGAFEQVNPNLLGAARTLGAGRWRTFYRVLLPLAWPGVMAGTVLAFARALGEFGATLMLAGNIPGRTQTLPVAIFFAAEGGDLRGALGWVGWMAAMSVGSIAVLNYWGRRTPAGGDRDSG